MALVEIDGRKIEARPGQMLIEAADEAGIYIPRFCYHKKLSIAANCRMCLVDVVNAPKPLPACATPITEGMKVQTKSPRTKEAQKAVMAFLLINHPLDCPVCDQGGQCELQDLSLEFGQDFSEFREGKRAVADKNLGPLVATEMTRCIHCTRCVRFGTEIAGVRELGAVGRGEHMAITTYVKEVLHSELSGNIIDLCPVGALTSKPFRFQARAWELQAKPGVSMHDCVGSHLYFHTLRDRVMRVLPRENEALNEVWLSDRDRFSYEGLNHQDRLTRPWIKQATGEWTATDWPTALNYVAEQLEAACHRPDSVGVLASPNGTLEEYYLLQKLFREKKCGNLDHRLRQKEVAYQSLIGLIPDLGILLEQLEQQEALLLVGSDLPREQPMIAHRLRKATLQGGKVYVCHVWEGAYSFPVSGQVIGQKGDLVRPLATLARALLSQSTQIHLPDSLVSLLETLGEAPSDEIASMAEDLLASKKTSVLLGAYAWSHPDASSIYALSRLIALLLQATCGEMTPGTNSAGAWLAGMVPHRGPMGETVSKGLTAGQMIEKQLETYFLLHAEPEWDLWCPQEALETLQNAKRVIALTAFDSPQLRKVAHVLLPVTPPSEMEGTFVNVLGDWEAFEAAVPPLGQSRPAWKILRVLGNLLRLSDFNYNTPSDIKAALAQHQTVPGKTRDTLQEISKERLLEEIGSLLSTAERREVPSLVRLAPVGLYRVDPIVRRAPALQAVEETSPACVKLSASQANSLGLQEGQGVWVVQNDRRSKAPLPIVLDDRLPEGVAWIASALEETQPLGRPFDAVQLIAAPKGESA